MYYAWPRNTGSLSCLRQLLLCVCLFWGTRWNCVMGGIVILLNNSFFDKFVDKPQLCWQNLLYLWIVKTLSQILDTRTLGVAWGACWWSRLIPDHHSVNGRQLLLAQWVFAKRYTGPWCDQRRPEREGPSIPIMTWLRRSYRPKETRPFRQMKKKSHTGK